VTPLVKSSRVRFAIKLIVVSCGIAVGIGYLSDRFRIGIDRQAETCFPGKRVYLIDRYDKGPFARGDLVAFRAAGLEPIYPDGATLIKQVAGIAGDRVSVRIKETTVNGRPVAAGLDLAGKMGLEAIAFERDAVVPEGSIFPMGEARNSFDGRYWGWADLAQAVGRARFIY
jgi:conjugal transfer pilin signal peptidase TrbI